MSIYAYRATCLTNLHMGSGDNNYSVVDLEVERDPVTGEPTMNATGVKGALKDHCAGMPEADIKRIFGTTTDTGAYKFFSGDLLGRPLRVSEGTGAWVLAVSPAMIRCFRSKAVALGIALADDMPNAWSCGADSVKKVEGAGVHAGSSVLLNTLLGTKCWVVVPDEKMKNYSLPVQAHNVLENGQSSNLWYEENVPHESVFGLLIMAPEGDTAVADYLQANPVVQFGAGATTGCGFTKLEQLYPAPVSAEEAAQ